MVTDVDVFSPISGDYLRRNYSRLEIHKGGEAFDSSLALALFDSFSCIFRVVLVLHTRILRIAGTLLEPSKGIIIPKALIIFL